MFGTKRFAVAVLGVMLGGAALAFGSQPGETVVRNGSVYSGYLDTQSWYGPLLFTLHVDSYASDGDVHAIETMLREKGQDAAFAALGDMQPNGWLQLDHSVGYPVTVLGEQVTGNGRQIVAIADRPLGFHEFWRGSRSLDYPFTLIVLNVDDRGEGAGTLVPAARAEIDTQGHISFDDLRRIPYRIMRVRLDRVAGS